jgi:hypothetical protein
MAMVSASVASLLKTRVRFELECIDRMYLNLYVPGLQTPQGLVGFLRREPGVKVYSTNAIAPMTRAFVSSIERFVQRHGLDLIDFPKGQRKEDIALEYRQRFRGTEGVLFVGKAQEKTRVFRTIKRRDARGVMPWIVKGTAIPNHYYFYVLDRDFGPLFVKFCGYFPYAAKVCLNGHEWLKKQLDQRGIAYQALDNGLLECADPKRAQRIAEELDEKKIEALVRKWLARLPHPFLPRHRQAGCRYQISVLQAEFSLTQVLDAPAAGRSFFEQVIRENLDLGRPEHVQLIFARRNNRRTPGRFRTCVVTHGVIPSLHVNYKHSRIKQYHKEGKALRTETVVNDTTDLGILKGLANLPALGHAGFAINRRLLELETLSHDCNIGAEAFHSINSPVQHKRQRASALRFGHERTMALLQAIGLFSLQPEGFSNRTLRERLAQLLGKRPDQLSPGSMTYDLRRLRLHGLIERIPSSHRYHLTARGCSTALFYSRTYLRLLQPALSWPAPATAPRQPSPLNPLLRAFDHFLESTHLLPAAGT